ncbi:splicing factor Cactin [Stomoxys calcitrans]|uniref:splicing factor Cactin n=1 Tax=Stomoxys calcitrans TaxID=35570 RepID=UPI0027E25FDE|nr:splicing factor Cactin [Stomoxys calcitrans]
MPKDKKHKKSEHGERRHKHKSKHKKSKKKYRSSSSSSSSSASEEESLPKNIQLLKALEERRLLEERERKRQKEEMKAKETPEQKRERRLREKEVKELRRKQRMGWDNEYQTYTDQDNPFGDSNLTSTFVWNKKLQKQGLKDAPMQTVEAINRQKQMENKIELEKVKKRRLEREKEKQEREEEMVLQQREKEAAQFHEWEKQEDQFHLEQARLRSEIRIQDGRAKPIDLLAQYINGSKLEDAIEMQMHEPYFILNGLNIKDLEDLLVDIKVYIELEKGEHIDFWNDMTIIVQDELQKQRKQAEHDEAISSRREGIHESVVKDVSGTFRNKTIIQLDELKSKIEAKIESRTEGIDISYWENILSQLKAHMARARLRDHHQKKLREKLDLLKTTSIKEEVKGNDSPESPYNAERHETKGEEETEVPTQELYQNDCFILYDEGGYSPSYIPFDSQGSLNLVDEEEDEINLKILRQQLLENNQESTINQELTSMRQEARKGMSGDEVEFSVEMPCDNSLAIQLATDKYRPRKPRYFNRVHTGFEWNKYNQTHYDMDNPPPKIVQGYKFNIFYPDLIDKSKTPQYFLTQCEDNPDFAILRFRAGPPYEDIAFKIVHREWEFSYKRGFRCQFHNNIFQLWFHFKRYRYRR